MITTQGRLQLITFNHLEKNAGAILIKYHSIIDEFLLLCNAIGYRETDEKLFYIHIQH